jgi:hypothetical protein
MSRAIRKIQNISEHCLWTVLAGQAFVQLVALGFAHRRPLTLGLSWPKAFFSPFTRTIP